MTDTKSLQERLRADAVEIAGWGAGNEAANVRAAAEALDAQAKLIAEAREVLTFLASSHMTTPHDYRQAARALFTKLEQS